MSDICLVVLCGLPACGKTTLCQKLMKASPSVNHSCQSSGSTEWIHVCYDEIFPARLERKVLEKKDEGVWKISRKVIITELDALLCTLKNRTNPPSKSTTPPVNSTTSPVTSTFPPVNNTITPVISTTPHVNSTTSHVNSSTALQTNKSQATNSTTSTQSSTTTTTVVDHTLSTLQSTAECQSRTLQIEDDIRHNFHHSVSSLCASCVKHKLVFLVDDNMYYGSMRYEFFQLARKYNCGFGEIYIKCGVETALRRNAVRTNKVDEDVIITMATKMEPPDKKNHWEENCLVLEDLSAPNVVLDVVQLVEHILCHPVQSLPQVDQESIESSREVCSHNILHQIDQILRKFIGKQLKQMAGQWKGNIQTASKSAQNIKQELISELHSGKLLIPTSLAQHAGNASLDPSNPLHEFIVQIFEQRFDGVS